MELVKYRKKLATNPLVLLIFGLPKQGKSTIVSYLKNHYIIEIDHTGGHFIDGRIHNVNKPSEFNELLTAIESSEEVIDYLIIDTISSLDEWSEIVGTYKYMKKPQGKSFNINPRTKKQLKHTDPGFQTVHEIPMGYGYRYSREVMLNWYSDFEKLISLKKVKHIILIAHVKDKLTETINGNPVTLNQIDLVGKVKTSYAKRLDGIARFERDKQKGYLNFDVGKSLIAGGRCDHLEGRILISEKNNGKIKTYWDKIYK